MGFVNERPENAHSQAWSEAGDRYPIKLFRDYLFHQVYEDGTPILDLAHLTESLNKVISISLITQPEARCGVP